MDRERMRMSKKAQFSAEITPVEHVTGFTTKVES